MYGKILQAQNMSAINYVKFWEAEVLFKIQVPLEGNARKLQWILEYNHVPPVWQVHGYVVYSLNHSHSFQSTFFCPHVIALKKKKKKEKYAEKNILKSPYEKV